MPIKLAINGFGRIGRSAAKIALTNPNLELVAINDLSDTKTLAYLLKHDSNYGLFHEQVDFTENTLEVGGRSIQVIAQKDPAELPWRDLGIDVVIESTGRFTDPAEAAKHITAGAKKVVISAPAKGDGAGTFVMGVNEDKLTSTDNVISNASCTTNCITPVAAVISARFGIEKAMMTTIHSYTASQALQDAPAKDLREGRNAAENIVPTSTGATIAAAKALPELQGVFQGLSIRVPTPVVSLSDFTFVTKQPTSVEQVNQALIEASDSPSLQGILAVTDEQLVSHDLLGNSHSAIVDLSLTQVVGDTLVKVVAWYDNEWGYSNRLVEMAETVGKHLEAPEATTPAPAYTPVPAPAPDASAPQFTPPMPVSPVAPLPQPIAPVASQPTQLIPPSEGFSPASMPGDAPVVQPAPTPPTEPIA